MPAWVAIHPTWRPITSHTMTRWCDSAVVRKRSMASVAVCTAVSNPKVTSVPDRSLSIVFGTPTAWTPKAPRRSATPRVSSPPTATSASTPRAARLSRTCSGPPSTVKGLVRDVPRIVPPWARMSRQRATSSSTCSSSMTPFQPSRKPITSSPCERWAVSTTARIAAFSPGQSPPPVRIPMRIVPCYGNAAGAPSIARTTNDDQRPATGDRRQATYERRQATDDRRVVRDVARGRCAPRPARARRLP